MKAYEIDSYAHGIRFSDESDLFYNSSDKVFNDQSGFNGLGNDVTINEGTPSFINAGDNSRRGIFIDNTMHGEFFLPNSWHGTMIVVCSISLVAAGTASAQLYINGTNPTINSNSLLTISHFSGNRTIKAVTGSAQVSAPSDTISTDGNLRVYAFSFDQNTRRGYSTTDGVTVSQSSEYTSNANIGNFLAWGGGIKCRVGNLSGVAGDTVASTQMSAQLFEQHCFTENVLLTDLDKVKSLIDDIKLYYAIP